MVFYVILIVLLEMICVFIVFGVDGFVWVVVNLFIVVDIVCWLFNGVFVFVFSFLVVKICLINVWWWFGEVKFKGLVGYKVVLVINIVFCVCMKVFGVDIFSMYIEFRKICFYVFLFKLVFWVGLLVIGLGWMKFCLGCSVIISFFKFYIVFV